MTSVTDDDQFPHTPHHCGGGLDAYVSSDSLSIKLVDNDTLFVVLSIGDAEQLRDELMESPPSVHVHTAEGIEIDMSEVQQKALLDWLSHVYPHNAPKRAR